MSRSIFAWVLLAFLPLACSSPGAKSDAEIKATLKKKVEEANEALRKENYAWLVDTTLPKVVENAGGRQTMIQQIEKGMAQAKAQGLSFVGSVVAEPRLIRANGKVYAIVPYTLTIILAGRKGSMEAFSLGISEDGGNNWHFVDGAATKERDIRQLISDWPKELKLPEVTPPKFE